MKTWNVIAKIGVALLAVAGAVVVVAKYGDKIVAWAKGLVSKAPCCQCECGCEYDCDGECTCEGDCDENCPCECECDGECECVCEEAPAEEVEEVAEEAPAAEEADFEG